MATQAAQAITVTDLEAKLDQFVEKLEEKLDSVVQRLQAQQEEYRQGIREMFAKFFPVNASDEPPEMKNQEHHELHQVITTRAEANPTKNPDISLENSVEHLVGTEFLEASPNPWVSELQPAMHSRRERRTHVTQARRRGFIFVNQSHHKVRKKTTRKRRLMIDPSTQINKQSIKKLGKRSRSFWLDSTVPFPRLLVARKESHRRSFSGYYGSDSQESSDGVVSRRKSWERKRYRESKDGDIRSSEQSAINGLLFWTNSKKAWEQVGLDSQEKNDNAADSIRVLYIGFQGTAPQVAMEVEHDIISKDAAWKGQKKQSQVAMVGRERLAPLVKDSHCEEEHREARVSRPLDENLRRCFSNFENYFGENNIPEQERLQIVYSNLEGDIGQWIKHLWKKNSPTSWKEFKCMMARETKTTMKVNHQPHYSGIQQEGSVREYRERFEALCLGSVILPGQGLEALFLQGLQPSLQTAVRELKPNGIVQMMDTAQWLEESNSLMVYGSGLSVQTEPKAYPTTQAELRSMVLMGYMREDLKDTPRPANEDTERLATQLKLPVVDSSIDKVSFSYRLASDVKRSCQQISLRINDIDIVENYCVWDLKRDDVDVILGYEWLSKLGETEVNWQNQSFSFIHNQDWVTLCAKNKDLEQGTKRVKMRSEKEQGGMRNELESDCGIVAYYLADKVALKGESKVSCVEVTNDRDCEDEKRDAIHPSTRSVLGQVMEQKNVKATIEVDVCVEKQKREIEDHLVLGLKTGEDKVRLMVGSFSKHQDRVYECCMMLEMLLVSNGVSSLENTRALKRSAEMSRWKQFGVTHKEGKERGSSQTGFGGTIDPRAKTKHETKANKAMINAREFHFQFLPP
ncbi:hypothetical protein AXX17_AT3G35780 [Arabidopsis thaliana]|uniref:Retrotransposon gag domain-containing protein n=1 Tax=Arabidopsis thaliana TaxID=3702 RepID=A0A178VC74_ARATH|nr:hypothetical protein AXX17_AT3G35780 [Arabidopsis thaliana]